jgi:hypothetical protein
MKYLGICLINYVMIIPRGEIFQSGLLFINGIFILTGIQYLSAKHMMYASGQST